MAMFKKINKKFIRIFLSNVLITIGLVPISILLKYLLESNDNLLVWTILSILGLVAVSYFMYRNEERKV